jgi:hypothetical protein
VQRSTKRAAAVALSAAAIVVLSPTASMAVYPRSDACGTKACGSATPTTWARTYVIVSESVSRKDCSQTTYAYAYPEVILANGVRRTGYSVTDYTCDGDPVPRNNVGIDGAGQRIVKMRVVVGLATSSPPYYGNWVYNPN